VGKSRAEEISALAKEEKGELLNASFINDQ